MTDSDVLLQDYLARLGRAAAGMDGERRNELLAGIEEHIEAARSAGVASDEAGMRTLLDRLGEPAEIVAAAGDSPPPGPAAAGGAAGSGEAERTAHRGRRRGTGLELAAVIMLTAGSFFLVMGWLVGVVLLWCSDRWRAGEKLLGTLVVPSGPAGLIVFGGVLPYRTSSCSTVAGGAAQPPAAGSSEVTTCTTDGFLEWALPVLLVTLLLASVAVPVWLYRTARRRADMESRGAPLP